MIYIASPYSSPDSYIREMRYRLVCKYCVILRLAGQHVFSPIAHWHNIAKVHELPHTFEHWQEHDFHMIGVASGFHVLALPGWEESRGVKAEIEYANDLNLPIKYYSPPKEFYLHDAD